MAAPFVEAKLQTLWEAVGRQQAQIEEMHMAHAAMRRCLENSGILTCHSFEIEHHRIRFTSMQQRHPSKVTSTLNCIMQHEEISKNIMTSLGYTDASHMCVASNSIQKTCIANPCIFVFGGLRGDSKCSTRMTCLHTGPGTWEEKPRFPFERSRFASVACSGSLYVIGGLGEAGRTVPNVDRLDLQCSAWETCPPMPTPRAACAAAALGGKISVLGGSSDGRSILNTVECYDVQKAQWSIGVPMTMQRSTCGALALEGSIYACGGSNASGILDSVECSADPNLQTWKFVANMLHARRDFAAGIWNGRLLVIGGFLTTATSSLAQSVESYRPSQNVWEEMALLLFSVGACACAVSKGKVYVFGGTDGKQPLDRTQCLDVGAKSWSIGPKMQEAIFSPMAVACTYVN